MADGGFHPQTAPPPAPAAVLPSSSSSCSSSLRRAFLERWPSAGAWAERLLSLFCAPHRHYHGPGHISQLLAGLRRLEAAGRVADPEALLLAVFFHDAVYAPGASDNEARSAALFSSFAQDQGLDVCLAARVEALILATADHRLPPEEEAGLLEQQEEPAAAAAHSRQGEVAQAAATAAPVSADTWHSPAFRSDAALFLDLDMSILAAPSAEYRQHYAAGVRAEYEPVVGRQAYVEGRVAFLESVLARPRLFLTTAALFDEAAARRNLQWELDALRSGDVY